MSDISGVAGARVHPVSDISGANRARFHPLRDVSGVAGARVEPLHQQGRPHQPQWWGTRQETHHTGIKTSPPCKYTPPPPPEGLSGPARPVLHQLLLPSPASHVPGTGPEPILLQPGQYQYHHHCFQNSCYFIVQDYQNILWTRGKLDKIYTIFFKENKPFDT